MTNQEHREAVEQIEAEWVRGEEVSIADALMVQAFYMRRSAESASFK